MSYLYQVKTNNIMKTVYYLPFDKTPIDLKATISRDNIEASIKIFKELFLSECSNVLVLPSFNGKEGFEVLPLYN